MLALQSLLKPLLVFKFAKPPAVAPGLYHYMRVGTGGFTRFHLRVEPEGNGLLLANANVAAHLTPTGVLIAHSFLNGADENKALNTVQQAFRGVPRVEMEDDVAVVQELIERLLAGEHAVFNLDSSLTTTNARLLAPLNADVPLAPPERMRPLIARLWAIGIPHLTVIVPERPNPEHLVRAIERAEDTGLITGVRARASDLMADKLIHDLAQAGVDHVDLFFASSVAEEHAGYFGPGDYDSFWRVLDQLRQYEVTPLVVIPLVANTIDNLAETLELLRQQHVNDVATFAIAAPDHMPANLRQGALPASGLPQLAALVEETAQLAQTRYLWQPPVQRVLGRSLAQQIRRGPRCSSEVSIRITPGGAVFAPRGPNRPCGQLFKDPWEKIWQNPAFQPLREAREVPRCDTCPNLTICSAVCPREVAAWSVE